MIYATYEYYSSEYCGEMIPKKAFRKMITKSSRYIDYFTYGRITNENRDMLPALSSCACDMAETIYRMCGEDGLRREIRSENSDGYSVTYVTEGTDGEAIEAKLEKKLYAIAKTYLESSGLLYLGVSPC